jgi:hypothetical protein
MASRSSRVSVALVARSEAWHLAVEPAGGTVAPRVLYRAPGMQVLGSLVTGRVRALPADLRAVEADA